MLDYYEKPKKKKKSKDEQVKVKSARNLKIIDDDVDFRTLKPDEDVEAMVDLLDPEGPVIVTDINVENLKKPSFKTIDNSQTKWKKIVANDDDDDLDLVREKAKSSTLNTPSRRKSNDDDSDLDSVPRRQPSEANSNRRNIKYDDDGDLSPVRRKPTEEEIMEEVRETRRRPNREEEAKKAKREEKLVKYMEWGKGLVQKKEKEEKLNNDLYEADKPLARYRDDKDLDRVLKEQEREDDPMLDYIRKNKSKDGDLIDSKPKPKYRGPPPPPNRYNLMPGPRWDGVDRSNGFEKRYYDAITDKKARQEQAYKWSVEDM